MSRRAAVAAAVAGTVAATIATLLPAVHSVAAPAAEGAPPTVTGADLHFHANQTLSYGSAEQAGLVAKYIDRIATDIAGPLQPSPTHPAYAGAVALAAHDGIIVAHDAVGDALRYSDDKPTELPPDQRIPMRKDTIFDLASMTKLFTSIAAVQLIEQGRARPRHPGRAVPARLRRQRQGRHHDPQPADPHVRARARSGSVAVHLPDARGAVGRALRGEARGAAEHHLRLQRREHDDDGQGDRRGHRAAARCGHRPRDHRAAAHDRHHVQPAGVAQAADRGRGVPALDRSRHRLGHGARRERVLRRRRVRARRRLLDRARHRGSRPGPAQRWSVPARADPRTGLGPGDVHQLQPGVPRQLARTGFRARPAVVHGRLELTGDGRAHRLHRHVDRHRPTVALVRDPADQPGASQPQLGQQQPVTPRRRAGPRLALPVRPAEGRPTGSPATPTPARRRSPCRSPRRPRPPGSRSTSGTTPKRATSATSRRRPTGRRGNGSRSLCGSAAINGRPTAGSPASKAGSGCGPPPTCPPA